MKKYILHEDPEYLIINKPAGLLVHGAKHIDEPVLTDELVEHYPEIKEVGDDPLRPGIVHRLDKLVSGLLLVARTQESFLHFKKQFQARTIEKYYTALVYGKLEHDDGIIEFPIKRSAKGHKMAALPLTNKGEKNTEGREAITLYRVTKRFINYTLVDVQIKTGRTHQIRVHFSALSNPLVGDDLYGTRKTKLKNQKLNLDRIYLHAHQLKFKDLAGETCNYESKLPSEYSELLQKIK